MSQNLEDNVERIMLVIPKSFTLLQKDILTVRSSMLPSQTNLNEKPESNSTSVNEVCGAERYLNAVFKSGFESSDSGLWLLSKNHFQWVETSMCFHARFLPGPAQSAVRKKGKFYCALSL